MEGEEAVTSSTPVPKPEELENIPDDDKIDFKDASERPSEEGISEDDDDDEGVDGDDGKDHKGDRGNDEKASKDDRDEEPFEILGEETRTFYLFARTSREKEEWFNRLTVGCHFMRDWNAQNPPPSSKERNNNNGNSEFAASSSTPSEAPKPAVVDTHKVKEQRFRIFMENYFQVCHDLCYPDFFTFF